MEVGFQRVRGGERKPTDLCGASHDSSRHNTFQPDVSSQPAVSRVAGLTAAHADTRPLTGALADSADRRGGRRPAGRPGPARRGRPGWSRPSGGCRPPTTCSSWPGPTWPAGAGLWPELARPGLLPPDDEATAGLLAGDFRRRHVGGSPFSAASPAASPPAFVGSRRPTCGTAARTPTPARSTTSSAAS